jgi:hypothetical protein
MRCPLITKGRHEKKEFDSVGQFYPLSFTLEVPLLIDRCAVEPCMRVH